MGCVVSLVYRKSLAFLGALLAFATICFATAAQAATCGAATSAGAAPADWQTYCWIDMSTYNNATVFGGGQVFSITLSDGSIFSFTLSGSSPNGGGIIAKSPPVWSGAAVGNTAFLGIPGMPILYTSVSTTTVNLTLSNIKVTPPNGVVSTGQFKLVVADGESTNNGESLTYGTNGGSWALIDQVPPQTGALYPTQSGLGTTTYTDTGVTGTVGAFIVGSQSPTNVTVQLVGSALQGVMLAVQYATISANKTIIGSRANAADQFTYGVKATSNGANITSASTSGAGLSGFTSAVATLSSGVPATIYEQMAGGSVSNINQYTPSLTCTNGAAGSPTVMPTALAATSFNMGSAAYGDAITCSFTNTPKPATVAIQKITTGAIGGAFTFTATNLASAPPSITTTSTGTATPAVPTAINVSAYNTAVTVTETPATNFTASSATCTDANSAVTGNAASFGSLAGNVLTIPAANVLAAAQITCTFTNTFNTATAATVAVQKITLGAAGGPFTFTATNLKGAPAAITTATVGTAYPTTIAPISATTVGTAVTITEAVAANFTINTASCVDTNSAASGNPGTAFGTLAGTVLTVPAVNIRAKAQITCTFNNIVNPAIPTVAVQKITTGAATGPFSFSATNLTGTISNITTVTPGTAAPVAPPPIVVTNTVTNVTLTEAANANFTLSSASCLDTNSATSGNPATALGSLAGNVLTIPVANLKTFAKFTCTFTNAAKMPTVAIQKITTSSFGGPFTFTATNLSSVPAGITTTAVGTAAPVAPIAIAATTASTAVTLTEAASASYTISTATCADANASITGNPASFGTLSGQVLTIPAANVLPAANITCTFTNAAKAASVAVQKITTGGFGGPFTFAVNNLAAAPASINTIAAATAAPAVPVASAVTNLNSVVQISEGSNSAFTFTTATCTDANSAVTGNPASFGTLSGLLITIPAANVLPAAQITCTFTNAVITPTVAIQKITTGFAVGTFNFTATNLAAVPAAITTAAVSTPTPAAPTAIAVTAANTNVLLTETANGSFTPTSATCSDANASNTGNPASFGSLSGNVLTIPAANVLSASQITCAFTNAAKPATVAVQKITTGGIGGPFTFAVTNLATAPAAITTATVGTAAPVAPVANTVTAYSTAVQITETVSSTFTFTSATCTDANSAVTGNVGSFGTVAGSAITVPAANVLPAAQITCKFTNAGKAPAISLQAALSSPRLNAADQFSLTAAGTGAPAAKTTTGTVSAITSTPQSFTGTAAAAYTLNEAMATGSSSSITAYLKTVACTNSNPVGTNVSGITTVPISFTAQAGDAISCVVTNNGTATPLLTITKTYAAAPTPVLVGQTVTYTYVISNTGNVTMTNISPTDLHGSPAVSVPLGAGGITNETLTTAGPLGAAASPDTTANNGIWSTLAPGATVTFTWAHTVTQAEIDHG